MKIDNFQHFQSAHCENGVTVALLKHHGAHQLTEPLVFGIGSGIFYFLIPFLKVHDCPAITYRTMPGKIFSRTNKALGIDINRKKFKDPLKAKTFLDDLVANNIPVGCQVGVYHLDYFPKEYRFHFNAHNLIVYGKEAGQYLISDPVMETTTTLSERSMNRVRFAKGALPPKGHVYYVNGNAVIQKEDLIRGIRSGIKRTVNEMIKAPGHIIGTSCIKYIGKRIAKWPVKLGEAKARLYLAHIVRMQEEIGTGGGGFRFLYAAFLEQSATITGIDELNGISDDFTKAGDLWRTAAVQMAGIYKQRLKNLSDYKAVSDLFMEIAEVERSAYRKLDKIKFN